MTLAPAPEVLPTTIFVVAFSSMLRGWGWGVAEEGTWAIWRTGEEALVAPWWMERWGPR